MEIIKTIKWQYTKIIKRGKKVKKSSKIILSIIIFITILIVFSTKWVLETYNNASFEQIIFHLTESINGLEKTIIYSYLTECLLITVIEFILVIYILKKLEHFSFIKNVQYSIVPPLLLNNITL